MRYRDRMDMKQMMQMFKEGGNYGRVLKNKKQSAGLTPEYLILLEVIKDRRFKTTYNTLHT
jgi:hypothetical protein